MGIPERVSSDDELLILVDSDDRIIGHETKAVCHDDRGLLHRAFSVFLFNARGEVLLQQRSRQKRLWPMFWSGSCCSHPRKGEEIADAARRRIRQELDLDSALTHLFSFQYREEFGAAGSEHELCSVYVGLAVGSVSINENEIHDWKWIGVRDLDTDMDVHPEAYTPWLNRQWARIRAQHWSEVEVLWERPPLGRRRSVRPDASLELHGDSVRRDSLRSG